MASWCGMELRQLLFCSSSRPVFSFATILPLLCTLLACLALHFWQITAEWILIWNARCTHQSTAIEILGQPKSLLQLEHFFLLHAMWIFPGASLYFLTRREIDTKQTVLIVNYVYLQPLSPSLPTHTFEIITAPPLFLRKIAIIYVRKG